MIKYKHLTLILMALCLIGWEACTQERQPCLTPKTASLNIETIHYQTDTNTVPIDTTLPGAAFIPLVGAGGTGGDYFYPPQSTFTISLSPDSTICRWAFSTDTLFYPFDTLTFYYQRIPTFLSNACGFADFYTLDSVHTTHAIIDSVHILNTNVTNNVNTKHLQIYIHHNF